MSAKVKKKYDAYARDPSGRLLHRVFTRAKDSEEWKAEIRRERERAKAGLESPSKTTLLFGDYIHYWIQELAKKRPISTVDDYGRKLRLHVLRYSEIAESPVSSLRQADFSLLLDHIQANHGLDNATRNRVRSILHKVYVDAVRDGVAKFNPITPIEIKKENPHAAVTLWTPEQAQIYLEGIREYRWDFYVLIQGYLNTGARKAELIPLREEHVDLEQRVIEISWILEQASGEIVQRTKSDGQKKVLKVKYVGISDTLAEVLEEHFRRRGKRDPKAFVFTDRGQLFKPRLITQIHTRMCARLGLPHCRIHDLRHLLASLLQKATGNIYAVKEQLGHSSVKTTERYIHSGKEEAAHRIAGFSPFSHYLSKTTDTPVTRSFKMTPAKEREKHA
jgi:integrase